MTIKAVICDMDGVLVDSEPIHQERIRQFFAEHGFEVPTEQLVTLVGCSGSYFDQKAAEWWDQVPRQGLDNETPDVLTAYSRWRCRGSARCCHARTALCLHAAGRQLVHRSL